jgi:hypothetical protein
MSNETIKTIRIDQEVHDRLSKHGTLKMTFEQVIEKLLDHCESCSRYKE